MTTEEYVSGLRQVADFFEQHPEITELPHPYQFVTLYGKDPLPILKAVAKAAGKARKNYTDYEFQVELHFGCFMVRYDAPREKVCERVVTGTKIIPAHTLPAREETFVEEKVEEIYEWKCPDSLLGGAA